jgi:hypothetical protein
MRCGKTLLRLRLWVLLLLLLLLLLFHMLLLLLLLLLRRLPLEWRCSSLGCRLRWLPCCRCRCSLRRRQP